MAARDTIIVDGHALGWRRLYEFAPPVLQAWRKPGGMAARFI